MSDEIINTIVNDISQNHQKIINDWCKAYMAQLYEEGCSIKPGDFTLCEQEPSIYDGVFCKRYWFKKGIPNYEKEQKSIQQLMLHLDELESLVYKCATETVDINKGLFPIVRLKNQIFEMFRENEFNGKDMENAPKDGSEILVELESGAGFDIVRFDGKDWVDKHGVCFGLEPIKWYALPEISQERHFCKDESSKMKCYTNCDGGLNLSYEYPSKDGGYVRVITQVEVCPFCGEQS